MVSRREVPTADESAARIALVGGLVIGERYKLVAKIGEGGFGEVWRARHVTLGVDVAIKVLNAQAASFAEVAQIEERFRFEAQISARISKKTDHVIAVLDAGVCEVGPFLAMELVVGRDLESMLDRGPLEPGFVARLLAPIGEALDVVHAAGIVHRDLKPANVLVGDDGQVKLFDFGIAKAIGTLVGLQRPKETDTGILIGTPEYMSPEQVRGVQTVSPAIDLWALGILAYEALTAMMPFGVGSAAEIMMRISERGFTPPSQVRPELPAEIDAWFARALAKEPGERFTSGREAAEAFQSALMLRTTAKRKVSRLSYAPPISIKPPTQPASSVGFIVASAAIGVMCVSTLFALNRASPADHVDAAASRLAPVVTAATKRLVSSVQTPPPRAPHPPSPTPERREEPVSEPRPAEAPPVKLPQSRDRSATF